MSNLLKVGLLMFVIAIAFTIVGANGCLWMGNPGGNNNSSSGSSGVLTQAVSPIPANNTINASITTRLSWRSVAEATSYDVYFGTTTTGWTPVTNTVFSSFSPSVLSYATAYYWRIDPKNDTGIITGAIWSFSTKPTLPGQAATPSPVNSGANIPVTALLSWANAADAASYNVYFGTTITPQYRTNTKPATYNPGSLLYGTTYYWRIDSKNITGITAGNLWTFATLTRPLPAQATSPSPANGAVNCALTAYISWASAGDASSYDVYFGISPTPTFITGVAKSVYRTAFYPGPLNYNTTYYWRINARNPSGPVTGNLWAFKTIPAVPAQTTLLSPANGTINCPITQILSWSAADRAASYNIYFGTSLPLTSTSYRCNTALTAYTPSYKLQGFTLYYWRVDSINNAGITIGNISSFTTISLLPPTIMTNNASTVTLISAVINGTVNPKGLDTTIYFNYGLTVDYTITTTAQVIGKGTNNVAVAANISGLTPGTFYNFRVVGVNINGTTYGNNLTFTTGEVQEAYIKASNTGTNDQFGQSVAISDDTLVVGADWESSNATGIDGNQADNSAPYSGAVYVFVRTGATWSQQAYIKTTNMETGDGFGYSVAISGNTIVVGALGEDSNTTGIDGNQADNTATNSGAAYVFVRSGTSWSQQAYIKASNTEAYDAFGYCVAISGDTIVVGARYEDSNATGINGNQTDNSATNSGAAYVFVRAGTVWSQQAYIKASNTRSPSWFSWSVAISGDTIAVGSPQEASNATGINGNQSNYSARSSGAVYVFVRAGTNWSQQAYIKASNTGVDDYFGYSVAVSGNTILVGAPQEDSNATGIGGDQTDNSASGSGAVYVFVRSGTNWSQQAYIKASNTDTNDEFGDSVTISGDTLAVGSWLESSNATGINGNQMNNSAASSGATYLFIRSGTIWSQQAYIKASNTGSGDKYAYSLAISGDTLVVGAYLEDSNATGINGNQADNSVVSSGAVYVIRIR